jgi:hypothetical protein
MLINAYCYRKPENICLTFNFKIVKNLKLLLLLTLGMGSMAMFSCSKSNNSSSSGSTSDSVLYSKWIAVVLLQDPVTTPGDTTYEQNISAPAITQAVMDQGAILTYVEFQGVVNYPSDFSIFPSFSVGNINLFAAFGVAATDGLGFRYVIVPGKTATTNVSGSLQTFTVAQIKAMNYATITKLFSDPLQSSGVQFVAPK